MSTAGLAGICFVVVAVVKRYADGTYDGPDRNGFVAFDLRNFGDCFPILVGAFGAHYNIPALYREVAGGAGSPEWNNTLAGRIALRRMIRVIVGAITLSSIVYGVVGAFVYATFGPGTNSDFTENFHKSDTWLVVVRLTMTLAICASFPLSMVSARNAVFNIFLLPNGWEMTGRVRVGLSTALTAFCLGTALVSGGNISAVLAFNGSVFGTPVCYIAPAIMYMRTPKRSQHRAWAAFAVVCAVAGIAFGVLGLAVVTLSTVRGSGGR